MQLPTLRRVQMCELDILIEIRRVCEKLDIPYWMDYVSLLGAVRHKGFIPWDDDIDIGMLRVHYERFLREAPGELKEKYYLQTWTSDPDYGLPYAKVRDESTLFSERNDSDKNKHKGVFVDIFPYDTYPEEIPDMKRQKKEQNRLRRLVLAKCEYKPYASDTGVYRIAKSVYYRFLRLLAKGVSKEKLIRQYETSAQWFNGYQTGFYYGHTGDGEYEKTIVNMENVESRSVCTFEGEKFAAPFDVDMHLSHLYGDYMTPPPPEARVSGHNVLKIEFEVDKK